MDQQLFIQNWTDESGNPAGGVTNGKGITISWQNGKLVDDDGNRKEPNGAFVDTVIQAAVKRLEYYQTTKFKCEENENAIENLKHALIMLEGRLSRRKAQGVEGTHNTHS